MYDRQTRITALDLIESGVSLNSVSKRLGVSRAALREWRDTPGRVHAGSVCVRCMPTVTCPEPVERYAYLLGLYLGDGCISKARKGVWVLRIACADAWPGLQVECQRAIEALRPGHRISRVQCAGYTMVVARWKHWPCLFPQHGPGRKHLRPIALEPWQREIVERHPQEFLRGLFHSDGCRITNWTQQRVDGELRRYEYPRYFFSNESADILGLCAWALDLLDIAYRRPKRNTLSVARREAVAALDEFVGPKC